MTKDEALRLALEALKNSQYRFAEYGYQAMQKTIDGNKEAITAIKAALEAKNEKPCPEFWDWLPKAYRHGDVGDEPRFTKYNMEVAFLAGKQSAALKAKDEPVAFKIYKPTPPRHATPNVRDVELPWVYDQDPSSGNVASMWVTPVQTLRSKK